jgi:Spy/CpxP family protein refolding chaperone
MRKMLWVSGFVLFLTSPLMAQNRQRPGIGFGGGAGQAMLLSQKSVQEELKLTEEQIKKVQETQTKQRESFQGLQQLSQDERREKFQALAKDNEKVVKDILKPDQVKRLKQISLQQRGLQAVNDPEVATALNLTEEQKAKVKSMQEENRTAARDLRQGGNRDEARTKLQEMRKANEEKIQTLLTSEQKAKWKELTGEPFKGEITFPGRRPRAGA